MKTKTRKFRMLIALVAAAILFAGAGPNASAAPKSAPKAPDKKEQTIKDTMPPAPMADDTPIDPAKKNPPEKNGKKQGTGLPKANR
jgi:hypothetical protein